MAMFDQVSETGRSLLTKIQTDTDSPLRGFLALLALRLAGRLPTVRRRVTLPVLFELEGDTGAVGVLRLEELADGPPGLHPDPGTMTFFVGDAAFHESARRAWRASAPRRAGRCVVWSVLDGDTPRDQVLEGSLGAAFAVGLRELHRLRRARGRLSPRRLDPRCAVTAAVDEPATRLQAVDGYRPKLEAAHEARLRSVVVAAGARRSPEFPDPPADLKVRGATTVDQAFRQSRRRLNPLFVVTSIVVVTLLLAVTLALSAVWRQREATRSEQQAAAAHTLVSTADTARTATPPDTGTALRLSAAAFANFPGPPETRSSLVSALTASRHISSTRAGSAVHAVASSADGRTVAVATEANTISLWDVTDRAHPRRTGTPLAGHTDSVLALAFTADGRMLASGGDDDTVILWDLSDRDRPRRIGIPLTPDVGEIEQLSLSRDGHKLAALAYQSAAPVLWDLRDRSRPRRIAAPPADEDVPVTSVAFSPDGGVLATGDEDGTVTMWEISPGSRPRSTGVPFDLETTDLGTSSPLSMAFSPDGKIIATGDDDGTIRFWDISDPDSPDRVGLRFADHKDDVAAVAFSPDGRLLAAASLDATVTLYDVHDPTEPRRYGEPLTGHSDAVYGLAFSPDRRTLVTGSGDGTLALWDLAGPVPLPPDGAPLSGRSSANADRISALASSADGRLLVAAGLFYIRVFDRSDHGRLLSRFHAGKKGIDAIALTRDGRTLAIAGPDDELTLWDLTKPGEPRVADVVEVYSSDESKPRALAFSPDGRLLAAAGGDVSLWDVHDPDDTEQLGAPLTERSARSVAFSPDGRILAAGLIDHTALLWDLAQPPRPRQVGALTGHTDSIYAITFSPVGHLVALGSQDRTVTVWDLTDVIRPRRLGPPLAVGGADDGESTVRTLAFSPDGRTLAGGRDVSVTMWDLTDPARVRPLGQTAITLGRTVATVLFSPDGASLLTGDENRDITEWDLAPLERLRHDPLAAACARDVGDVSPADWARYAPGVRYRGPCRKP